MKARAGERLDEAIGRLEKLEPDLSGADPLVAQNARFRLAQALADRAGLEGDANAVGRDRLRRALAAIDPMPTESAVEGHARLLRADVLARLGELDRAEEELDATARLKSPPSGPELAEVRTRILLGQRRYNDAVKAIDGAGIDTVARDALAVEVRLAQRLDGLSGPARIDVESDAFRRARTLRGSSRPEARAALRHFARALDEPPPHAEPDDWDLLADAALGLGDAPRASKLVVAAAERARTLGRPEEAARLLLRAGAILFQGGDYAGADALLGRSWDAPKPNPTRPKAGLLRALARGRALADPSGASRSGYVAALRDLIREYPDDPNTPEARWLLAEAERDEGRTAEAVALWKAIPAGHPRWLASRLAIAAENQREVDDLRIGDDATTLRDRFREAVAFLRESAQRATVAADVTALDLAAARLDLTPTVGRPELARSLCDRIARQAGSAEDHARARVLRLVALGDERQRINEAEAEIRTAVAGAPAADLLAAARLIDHAAESVESEATRLRLGRLARAITDAASTARGRFPRRRRLAVAELPGRPARHGPRGVTPRRPGGSSAASRRSTRPASTWTTSATWRTPSSAWTPPGWPSRSSGSAADGSGRARRPGWSRAISWPSPCIGRGSSARRARSSTPPRSSTRTSAAPTSSPGSNASASGSTRRAGGNRTRASLILVDPAGPQRPRRGGAAGAVVVGVGVRVGDRARPGEERGRERVAPALVDAAVVAAGVDAHRGRHGSIDRERAVLDHVRRAVLAERAIAAAGRPVFAPTIT